MRIQIQIEDEKWNELSRFCQGRGLDEAEFFALAVDLALWAEKKAPWALSKVLKEARKGNRK